MRQRQGTKVERFARVIDGNPVDDYFVVSGLAAANKERGDSAALPRTIHDRARQKTHGVVRGNRLHYFQLLAAQSVNVSARGVAWNWGASRGHHHGFRRRRQSEFDGDDFRSRGKI